MLLRLVFYKPAIIKYLTINGSNMVHKKTIKSAGNAHHKDK